MRRLILFLICFCFILSTAPPTFAKKKLFYTNKIHDFSQLDIDGAEHNYGRMYCAPTAASNILRWWHVSQVDQAEIIKLLASDKYMKTDPGAGTSIIDFAHGMTNYMKDRLGGYHSISFKGLAHRDEKERLIKPDWLMNGLGFKKATWLLLGTYKYNPQNQNYEKVSGHIVNLVGYDITRKKTILVIHDPATTVETKKTHDFVEFETMEEGTLKLGNYSTPAKGLMRATAGQDWERGLSERNIKVVLEGAIRVIAN